MSNPALPLAGKAMSARNRVSSVGPLRPLLIALILVSAAAGCGNQGPQRFDVSGRVTFRGQPVPAGTIIFEPDSSQGNEGPQGIASIKQGVFDTASGGKGIVGGRQIVTILGCDGVNITETSPQGKTIFDPYTTTVDLPKKTSQIDFNVP